VEVDTFTTSYRKGLFKPGHQLLAPNLKNVTDELD